MDKRMFRAGVIVSVAALLATTACSSKSPAGAGSGGLSGVSAPPVTAPAPTPATAVPTDTATSSTATGTHTTKPAGPKIVTFDVKQKAICPVVGGGTAAPYMADGQDLILEWTVPGATKVALSLDDKNWFKNNHTGSIGSDYPPSGSLTVPFACDEAQQPFTVHTYTLDAVNGTAEKTISVSARTDP
jgi:hypothetical protein